MEADDYFRGKVSMSVSYGIRVNVEGEVCRLSEDAILVNPQDLPRYPQGKVFGFRYVGHQYYGSPRKKHSFAEVFTCEGHTKEQKKEMGRIAKWNAQ